LHPTILRAARRRGDRLARSWESRRVAARARRVVQRTWDGSSQLMATSRPARRSAPPRQPDRRRVGRCLSGSDDAAAARWRVGCRALWPYLRRASTNGRNAFMSSYDSRR
jgi:hypothetical protein